MKLLLKEDDGHIEVIPDQDQGWSTIIDGVKSNRGVFIKKSYSMLSQRMSWGDFERFGYNNIVSFSPRNVWNTFKEDEQQKINELNQSLIDEYIKRFPIIRPLPTVPVDHQSPKHVEVYENLAEDIKKEELAQHGEIRLSGLGKCGHATEDIQNYCRKQNDKVIANIEEMMHYDRLDKLWAKIREAVPE